jgi:hypothetical protein
MSANSTAAAPPVSAKLLEIASEIGMAFRVAWSREL